MIERSVMRNVVLWILAAYKRVLSPRLPLACRYTPTCSEYAAEAVAMHGAARGIILALWRLLRCQPFGGRGLDQVPRHFCGSHPRTNVNASHRADFEQAGFSLAELSSQARQQKAGLAEAGHACIRH